MRITNNMMISKLMLNLNRNMLRMDKTMLQASTGKKYHLPSDNPVAITKSMKIKTDLSQMEQYKKNVDDVVSFLETTELAIKGMGDALSKIRELTVQASNGVLTVEERVKIQEEMAELKNQIVTLGNTTYAGQYIFSGKSSDKPLLEYDSANQTYKYNVDLVDKYVPTEMDDKILFEVGINDRIAINTLGFELFDLAVPDPTDPDDKNRSCSAGDSVGLIDFISEIEGYLQADDDEKLTGALEKIDQFINVNLTARAQVGAKVNRMELVQNRIADDKINFTNLQSEIEDADLAEVYMNLLTEENVYRSSLSIGARIIQPSLLDFLR